MRLSRRLPKNVEVTKDFLKYFIQPKVKNEYLKVGLGRNIPCMPSIVRNDSWWFEDPHRKAYVEQGLLRPTIPEFYVYNPAYAQVRNEHVWGGHHKGRHDSGGRGGEGVQTGRGDLREIPD